MRRLLLLAIPLAALAVTATATSGRSVAASCSKADLTTASSGTLTVGTDNPAYPPWFGGNRRRAQVEDQRPVLAVRASKVRGRLRGREAARLRAGKREVEVRAVREVVRAGQEGVRLRHQPDLVHAGARQGRRLQQLLLRRQPGGRRPQGHEDRFGALARGAASGYKFGVQIGTTSYSAIRRADQADLEAAGLRHERQGRVRAEEQADRRRSSSTCRPRSTSPPCRSRRARSSASFATQPGGEHFGMVFQKGSPLTRLREQGARDAEGERHAEADPDDLALQGRRRPRPRSSSDLTETRASEGRRGVV